jgi:roundabout axon guidance receptor 2
MCPL